MFIYANKITDYELSHYHQHKLFAVRILSFSH